MILNLASVCNAESSEILWGFIENYYPIINKKDNRLLNKLLSLELIIIKNLYCQIKSIVILLKRKKKV